MRVYDYFLSYNDMQANRIYATFTEHHESERKHFESLCICPCCKVSTFNAK